MKTIALLSLFVAYATCQPYYSPNYNYGGYNYNSPYNYGGYNYGQYPYYGGGYNYGAQSPYYNYNYNPYYQYPYYNYGYPPQGGYAQAAGSPHNANRNVGAAGVAGVGAGAGAAAAVNPLQTAQKAAQGGRAVADFMDQMRGTATSSSANKVLGAFGQNTAGLGGQFGHMGPQLDNMSGAIRGFADLMEKGSGAFSQLGAAFPTFK